jgi:hypothetical protein
MELHGGKMHAELVFVARHFHAVEVSYFCCHAVNLFNGLWRLPHETGSREFKYAALLSKELRQTADALNNVSAVNFNELTEHKQE